MKQGDWARAYTEARDWRRHYGGGVPVVLVAASPEMRGICQLLDSLIGGARQCILVHGPQGSGKSSIVSAAQAAFIDAGIQYRQAFAGGDHKDLIKSLAAHPTDEVVVIDDCSELTTFRRFVEVRENCRAGMLLTSSRVPVDISTLLTGAADSYVRLPSIADRPNDLLLLASLMWERLAGNGHDLSVLCDELAVEALLKGFYPGGGWSLEEVLNEMAELHETDESAEPGRIPLRMSYHDIAPIFFDMIRRDVESPPVEPMNAILVVEGDTDVSYLRHAAQVAEAQHGWSLLDGLEVQASGSGRDGGAEGVVRRVLELRGAGVSAMGLFDLDVIGQNAFDMARRQDLQRMLLPTKFDPLLRNDTEVRVEIEDLLPVEVLASFYATNEALSPEEIHWRRGRWRIVPRGEDKDSLAAFVEEVAGYSEMERFVYLLVQVRGKLRLPCPNETSPKSWLARLAHELPSETMTLILSKSLQAG